MELLKNRILSSAKIIDGRVIKVDGFLNHQLDIELLNELGKEFKSRFAESNITKILTVEASGIAIAAITAQYFHVPVLFAKKGEASNMDQEVYAREVFSYTKNRCYHIRVAKKFLSAGDNVLIIDDFLAQGNAVAGLIDIVQASGANVAGVGIVIEKGFQEGRRVVQKQGIKLESLAVIESVKDGVMTFAR